METRQLVSQVLIWGGVGFILGGLVLSPFIFPPYIKSLIQSRAASARPTSLPLPTQPLQSRQATAGPTPSPTLPNLVAGKRPAEVPLLLPFNETAATETPAATRAITPTLPPVQTQPIKATTTPKPATPTATIKATLPVRISIPDINLEAPVVAIEWTQVEVAGQKQAMWKVPDWRAAGWHNTSAGLGMPGNTVLNGHNTSRGEVFRDLYKLESGALIEIEGGDGKLYTYQVHEVLILPEAGQPLEVRIENARYIQATEDERLTLVTCHPYGSLRNRLVVVAFPTDE